ncbi:hypothetical protein BT96DRAFT_996434 [Gymnopus androsaceus JB14]|uniref:Uncharacterized protein n=1 Tax=Gymnopus androsaceus JB14 TaxID=1447944 RepID=A0A6A4HI73_9AGAR|nr:hypothetical protein BT96DRAFT_996434 [Gymnopus androsaceus JB14]
MSFHSSQSSFSRYISRLLIDPLVFSNVGDPVLYGIPLPRRTASNLLVTIALGTFLFDIVKTTFNKTLEWAAGNGQRHLREMIRQRTIVKREIARTERQRRKAARELHKIERDFQNAMSNVDAFAALPFDQHDFQSLALMSEETGSQAALVKLRRQAHAERCQKLKGGCDELDKEIEKTAKMVAGLLA